MVDLPAFVDGLLARLGAVISFDGAFLAVVDPATLLYTQAFRRGMPSEASAAFLAAELGDADVNQLRQLVRLRSPFGWLDQATAGDRMAARRYRLAMRPHGLGDELRVALIAGGDCWGLLCLHRAEAIAGFDPSDGPRLAALAPHIAAALRRALLRAETEVASATNDGPAIVLLDAAGAVRSASETAARWLEELADIDDSRSAVLPTVVASVVEQLKEGTRDATPGASARVRVRSGRWLTVHASWLDDEDRPLAVIVEPTNPNALAPLIIAAYGLTPRESEVTRRLLTGLPRKTIASELHLSLHTVGDHVKAIFDKTGSSSTGELRTRVFRQGAIDRS
jgi:DNA-binding NarL/FixJ family response regulator